MLHPRRRSQVAGRSMEERKAGLWHGCSFPSFLSFSLLSSFSLMSLLLVVVMILTLYEVDGGTKALRGLFGTIGVPCEWQRSFCAEQRRKGCIYKNIYFICVNNITTIVYNYHLLNAQFLFFWSAKKVLRKNYIHILKLNWKQICSSKTLFVF